MPTKCADSEMCWRRKPVEPKVGKANVMVNPGCGRPIHLRQVIR